jgi:hypothetical protein
LKDSKSAKSSHQVDRQNAFLCGLRVSMPLWKKNEMLFKRTCILNSQPKTAFSAFPNNC